MWHGHRKPLLSRGKVRARKGCEPALPTLHDTGAGRAPHGRQGLRSHHRHRPRPDGSGPFGGCGHDRPAVGAPSDAAGRRLYAVQRLRRPQDQRDRRPAELGGIVLFPAPRLGMNADPLLRVENLTVAFRAEGTLVPVVDGIGFSVPRGKTVGLVGESGSGKTMTAHAVMRLLPPSVTITSGRIAFDGIDLANASEPEMQHIRGDRIGLIFQDPMTSLNPTMRVGDQIAEMLLLHRAMSRRAAEPQVIAMLRKVGIGSPELRSAQFPHELSGGLRQRVMIAMALICGPKLLIADEPTTALDVTIQAQILELMKTLQQDRNIAVLLITHDLGVVEEICREVVVMYAGRIVEKAPAGSLLAGPRHPYTAGLLAAAPRKARHGQPLPTIPGTVPPPGQRGTGCTFAARCARVLPRCRRDVPPLSGDSHRAACWNPMP